MWRAGGMVEVAGGIESKLQHRKGSRHRATGSAMGSNATGTATTGSKATAARQQRHQQTSSTASLTSTAAAGWRPVAPATWAVLTAGVVPAPAAAPCVGGRQLYLQQRHQTCHLGTGEAPPVLLLSTLLPAPDGGLRHDSGYAEPDCLPGPHPPALQWGCLSSKSHVHLHRPPLHPWRHRTVRTPTQASLLCCPPGCSGSRTACREGSVWESHPHQRGHHQMGWHSVGAALLLAAGLHRRC